MPPTDEQLAQARGGEVVLIEDPARNEIRALVFLADFFDSFLYVSHPVQGDVLRLLDETRDTMQFYERLERERGGVLLDYAVLYLGFALLVILASIMLGLRFAERLAKPVGRLAGAAEQVGAGNLEIRVKEERGDDEIAMLSRVFNRMTGQLKTQRDALVRTRDETERRRQFIEAVLSGVTAGVIGLDGEGRVELINEAAAEMLALDAGGGGRRAAGADRARHGGALCRGAGGPGRGAGIGGARRGAPVGARRGARVPGPRVARSRRTMPPRASS